MTHRKLTLEQEHHVARLYADADMPIAAIAKQFSIAPSSVQRAAQRQGVPSRAPGSGLHVQRLSDEKRSLILHIAQDAVSQAEIARAVGVSESSVHRVLQRHNRLRTPQQSNLTVVPAHQADATPEAPEPAAFTRFVDGQYRTANAFKALRVVMDCLEDVKLRETDAQVIGLIEQVERLAVDLLSGRDPDLMSRLG